MIKIELPDLNLDPIAREKWKLFYHQRSNNASENWEKDIWNFLLSWISEEDSIFLKTSGSTGVPKNITIKKSVLVFSAQQTIDFFKFGRNENWLLCLPAGFVGGQMVLVRAILCGAKVYAVNPKIEWKAEMDFDFASMIPMQVENYLLSKIKIKRILMGGSSVPKKLEERLRGILGTDFYASYGMTETVSHIALRKINGSDSSEYFVPFKNILIGKDDRGCLTIYNRNYSEDVLITNDLVEFNNENNFKIIGRADHIINSGGLKIIPEEIERLLEHLFTQRILVIGIPDEKTGEKPILLIEGTALDAFTLKLVENFIKENIAKNKQPKEIIFINKFSETENGKVNRRETRASYLNLLGSHL